MREGKERKIPRTKSVDKCPVCLSKNFEFLFASSDRMHSIPGEYAYHQCLSCQTVFQNPMVLPEDLHLCYPTDYYTHDFASSNNDLDSMEIERLVAYNNFKNSVRRGIIDSTRKRKVKGIAGILGKFLSVDKRIREKAFYGLVLDELLPRQPENLRALEIGCGSGELLKNLSRVGWQAEGVEWDEKSATIAQRNSGCRVKPGDFRKIDLPLSFYDLIVLNHVFEHIDAPLEALERLKDLLAEDGRIVLIYPNAQSLGARIYKANWMPWEVPRHLVFPSVSGFEKIIKKMGLEMIRRKQPTKSMKWFLSQSHNYKNNRPAKYVDAEIFPVSHALGWLERMLTVLGFNLGEESILIIKKKGK